MLSRKTDTGTGAPESSVPDNFVSSLGAGHPLDKATRDYFEPRFGMDFGHVRIHAGQQAAHSAKSINALAYTLGNNVVFGTGLYQPHTVQGKRLLAHELAHTIQQQSQAALQQQSSRLNRAGATDEHADGREADTIIGGNRRGYIATPMLKAVIQRTRSCHAGSRNGDSSTVTCSDGTEYEVQTIIERGIVPDTQAGALAGLDRSTIYLRIRVCRGSDEVQIITGIDVAQPVRQLIENVLRGTPGSTGVRLEPEMRITWARSRDFEIEVYGGPTWVGGAPRTGGFGGLRARTGSVIIGLEIGSDPTLTNPRGGPELHVTGTFGIPTDPVREVDCHTEDETVSYRCTPITHTRPVDPIQPDDVQVYVFFKYASADVIEPTPRILRGSEELTGASLDSLAREGYRALSIDAHTSPEGPRGPSRRREGFIGNDQLSASRGREALNWLRTNCPDCISADPLVSAESELYSGYRRPGVELEGYALTRRAREGFLGRDVEPVDPLRRPEHDLLGTLPVEQQQAELYPLLRRAVIHLHREGVHGVPSRPERGATFSCPADVRDAMQSE